MMTATHFTASRVRQARTDVTDKAAAIGLMSTNALTSLSFAAGWAMIAGADQEIAETTIAN